MPIFRQFPRSGYLFLEKLPLDMGMGFEPPAAHPRPIQFWVTPHPRSVLECCLYSVRILHTRWVFKPEMQMTPCQKTWKLKHSERSKWSVLAAGGPGAAPPGSSWVLGILQIIHNILKDFFSHGRHFEHFTPPPPKKKLKLKKRKKK